MKVYKSSRDTALETIGLASTMAEKFGITGPEINGSKFVINYDPDAQDKKNILKDCVKAFLPDLFTTGTAGDLDVSEQEAVEVLALCGIKNP